MWKAHLKRCRTPQLRQQFVEFARQLGVAMGGPPNVVGEPYYNPFGTDDELQATLDGLRTDVDFALSVGTRDVLIWEGVRPPLLELLRAAIRYGASQGARFLVEPHPFTVGMNDDFLIALYDSLDSQHFGITYDCCH